jgi:RNA polymerase sigma-70 factor (ECF subfamily)
LTRPPGAPDTALVPRSEETWVDGLRAGGGAAYAEDVADLRDYLQRTLAKGFNQKLTAQDLDDLTQETPLRIHQKLDTFQGQCRFTTWAATIAVNCALSELRRRRYQHVSLEDAAEQADWSAGDDHTSEAQIEALRRGIKEALTERQREAIEAALGGLPLTELARRQGVSQGAIYKLLHDARRRLKGYLEALAQSDSGALQESAS